MISHLKDNKYRKNKELTDFLKSELDGVFYTVHASILVRLDKKKYLFAIEDFIGAKISSISTSPERDDTILVENPFEI